MRFSFEALRFSAVNCDRWLALMLFMCEKGCLHEYVDPHIAKAAAAKWNCVPNTGNEMVFGLQFFKLTPFMLHVKDNSLHLMHA